MFLWKRDPYKLKEEEMTPEEYDIVFPADDGIDFKWGESYIKYRDTIKGVGGKYWRWNEDGSITEFDPVQKRLRVALQCLRDEGYKNYKIIKNDDIIILEFENKNYANSAEQFFLDVFWTSRSIVAKAENKILKIECILKGVQESTYFPVKY